MLLHMWMLDLPLSHLSEIFREAKNHMHRLDDTRINYYSALLQFAKGCWWINKTKIVTPKKKRFAFRCFNCIESANMMKSTPCNWNFAPAKSQERFCFNQSEESSDKHDKKNYQSSSNNHFIQHIQTRNSSSNIAKAWNHCSDLGRTPNQSSGNKEEVKRKDIALRSWKNWVSF